MKHLEFLTPDQVTAVHQSSLRVMETVGVKMEHPRARDALRGAGCKVDDGAQLVKFPPQLVEEHRRRTPAQFTVYGCDRKVNLELGRGNVYHCVGTGLDAVDLDTGERRPGMMKDINQAARLAQVLDDVQQVYPGVSWVYDEWVPPRFLSEHIWGEMFKVSTKPNCMVYFTQEEQEIPNLLKIAEIAAGGPDSFRRYVNVTGVVCPIPPLDWNQPTLSSLFHFAAAGVPLIITPGVTGGGTGPATLAGILVQAIAEFLGGVVLAQVLRPGSPVLFGHYNSIMDMRYGTYSAGSVECALLGAAAAQMARFYQVPSFGFYLTSDSHLQDEQLGYEKAVQWLLGGLAGVEVLHGTGNVTDNTLFSVGQMVIDTDLAGMVRRARAGVPVDAERLAVPVIQRVGPMPGTFLGDDHTKTHYRKEFFMPKVSEKRGLELWKADGARDVTARGRIRARQLLESYECPVDPEVVKALDAFLASLGK